MRSRLLVRLIAAAVTLFGSTTAFAESSVHSIRIGMIGLDTSHVVAFTRIMNDPEAIGALKDVHIVAAWPGGSPDFPLIRDRVQGFTKQVKDMGVEVVNSIEALLLKVDAVLYEVMGRGCTSVTAVQTQYTESVCGVWNDGRVGRYRSIREHTGKTGLGVIVFGTKRIVYHNRYYDYEPLCVEIAEFFKTRKPPIEPEETLEVFAFMEAAEESKRRDGVPVSIEEVMLKARLSPTSLGVTPSELIEN